MFALVAPYSPTLFLTPPYWLQMQAWPALMDELVKMYEEYYAKDSFVHIVEKNIDLKQVVNTNKCLIHLEKHGDKLLIISCVDNLLKGASGQAVHNMNLMFNLEETVGLRLKPSAF